MVRLKREIEGIRVDRAVPAPAYALQPDVSARILPWLDAQVRGREPGRVLLAGVPRADLAVDLARADHWVTLCDLDDEAVAQLHASLEPRVAGRLTLVDRSYSDTAFAPSSFDLIVLSDTLHACHEPVWLVGKAVRELKPDACLAARVLVQGALPVDTPAGPDHPASRLEPLELQALARVEAGLRGPLGPLLAGRRALEAIDRGAHLQAARFAADAQATLQAIGQGLHVEQVFAGHTLRLRLADALYGLRGAVRTPLLTWLARLPEQATQADLQRTDPRVVGVWARRRLGGWR